MIVINIICIIKNQVTISLRNDADSYQRIDIADDLAIMSKNGLFRCPKRKILQVMKVIVKIRTDLFRELAKLLVILD